MYMVLTFNCTAYIYYYTVESFNSVYKNTVVICAFGKSYVWKFSRATEVPIMYIGSKSHHSIYKLQGE